MSKRSTLKSTPNTPALDIRSGGLRITVQRVPAWLVGLLTTGAGVVGTWRMHR
ncbi:hypothetical protein ACFWC9_09915 [Streptomyces goshikiensis]|uniref:hypothetical protein n=1 Tax=Streptomyces goshikiensis TaxID=1942 RepID=UPI003685C2A0